MTRAAALARPSSAWWTAFCVLPLAGLVVFWVGGPGGGLLVALLLLEVLAVAGLGVQVVLYARLARGAA